MSHKSAKREFDALTRKDQENLFKEINGSRIIPPNLSGAEIGKAVKIGKEKGFFEKLFSSDKPKDAGSLGDILKQ